MLCRRKISRAQRRFFKEYAASIWAKRDYTVSRISIRSATVRVYFRGKGPYRMGFVDMNIQPFESAWAKVGTKVASSENN